MNADDSFVYNSYKRQTISTHNSTDELVSKMKHTFTMKYCFSIERSRGLLLGTAFMNLKSTFHDRILRKVLNSQNHSVGLDDRERSLAAGSGNCLQITKEHAGTLGVAIAMF